MVQLEKKWRDTIITCLSVLLILIGIFYISNIFQFFGIYFTIVPYCALIFMFVLSLVFLIYPARKSKQKDKLPWYDILFIVMSVVSTGYITFFPFRWEPLLVGGTTTWVEQSLCFFLIISIIEATRRTVNLSMALIATFFVIHLLFGSHFPSVLTTSDFSLERIASIFYIRAEGIFGVPIVIASTIILAFMIFSALLQNTEAGKVMLDIAFALTGRWKGGPAKAAIVGSAALGTMVGATSANVASTGSITIPLMKKTGYKSEFAGAVECVASNGGQIMPPVMGAVAFLIAELLSMPYWQVCVHAFFPAILYFIAIFVQVHYEAVKLDLQNMVPEKLPSFRDVFKKGWFYLIPIGILLYMLAILKLPVAHSGLYASMLTLVVIVTAWQIKKETRKSPLELLKWMVESMEIAAKSLLTPAVACAAAGIIIGSLSVSGLGFRLSSIIVDTSGGNLGFLLILTAISSFILGMGMTSIPCYLILVTLVAPALIQLGVEAIAAHLFVFYWGLISFITPPVAIAAYVASGISGGQPMKTGFIAMRLGIITYIIPFLFVYNPTLIFIGSTGMIAVSAVTAIIGVVILGIGLEGYCLQRLNYPERLLLIASGVLLLIPGYKNLIINLLGALLGTLVFLWHVRSSKKITTSLHLNKEKKHTESAIT